MKKAMVVVGLIVALVFVLVPGTAAAQGVTVITGRISIDGAPAPSGTVVVATSASGAAVGVAMTGGSGEDVAFIHQNPLFELYNCEYVINPLTVAQNENMVAINQGLAIDLTGQSTAETIGSTQFAGPGGQPSMVMGAIMARGGRSIIVVPSTTNDGKASRIVPMLGQGASITVPRYLADIVVTEYGVANLRWKTTRERAQALINIAHPDFRKELEQAAKSRFWPH